MGWGESRLSVPSSYCTFHPASLPLFHVSLPCTSTWWLVSASLLPIKDDMVFPGTMCESIHPLRYHSGLGPCKKSPWTLVRYRGNANWWRTVWRFLRNLKRELSYDPAIPFLGIYLKKKTFDKFWESTMRNLLYYIFLYYSQSLRNIISIC